MPAVTKSHASSPAPLTTRPNVTPAAQSTSLATDPLPTSRVNKCNFPEIKTAIDDIVKDHLVEQAFTQSSLHPTVHLALGYASVLISLGLIGYCYKMPFEEQKPYLWVAVLTYGACQSALWAWKRWVEKGEVFRGRRRRIVKRIETDLIQIHTQTTLHPPPSPILSVSPDSRPSSPTSPTGSTPGLSPSSSISTLSEPLATPSGINPHPRGPTYLVHLTLSTTSNNGKSLIHKARVISGKPIGEVVDEDGGVEAGEVQRWIAGLLDQAGVVGVEEDEGFKNE